MPWIWRIVLIVIAIPLVLLLAGFVYQTVAEAVDARRYLPPGRLVDVGGYRLHIYCTGEQQAGTPTVILDALFPGSVSNWAWVQPEVARVTRVCSYDRAGHGWSDPGPEPRDAVQHARELHTLLANAGIAGPYVLVGHSLGGLYVQMFAEQYPSEVAGMVLVESTHPDAWARQGKPEGVGADPNQLAVAPVLARFGVFRLGLIPTPGSDPDLPPQQFAELQAYLRSTKYFETIRDVNTAFPSTLAQVRALDKLGKLGAIPLAVVVGTADENASGVLFTLQEDLAALSTNSTLRRIDGANHAGLVDKHEYALRTSAIIREVVEDARTSQPVNR
jgi:pimeloyl-ACP methyl ester carboxylesterase